MTTQTPLVLPVTIARDGQTYRGRRTVAFRDGRLVQAVAFGSDTVDDPAAYPLTACPHGLGLDLGGFDRSAGALLSELVTRATERRQSGRTP